LNLILIFSKAPTLERFGWLSKVGKYLIQYQKTFYFAMSLRTAPVQLPPTVGIAEVQDIH